MGSPRPSFGRAENYGPEGRYEYGRLGGPRLGLNNLNSCKTLLHSNSLHIYQHTLNGVRKLHINISTP